MAVSISTLQNWLLLALFSTAIVIVFEGISLPATFLIGPMLAATILAVRSSHTVTPRPIVLIAQGFVGCLMANAIPVDVMMDILEDWPIFLTGIAAVIGASAMFGWLLAYMKILPGTTAIWGSMPGAASAMTLMSESYGADMRLVAIMQYSRVLCVALAAALISRFYFTDNLPVGQQMTWFPPFDPFALAMTVLVVAVSLLLAHLLKFQSGAMLFPILIGTAAQDLDLMKIELPPWLLAASFVVIGWSIGQRFTPELLRYAARALPRILASILALITVCAVFAFILMSVTGVDPMTAYLSTSPVGADSVAILSASAKVDTSFVMAMQIARFLVVLLIGPLIARMVVHLSGFAKG